jgi:hypothetical protein
VSEAEHVDAPKTDAAGDADLASTPGKPSRGRRMIHILVAALVAVVLPVVLLYLLLGELGARAVVIGLLLGVLGSKVGGTRRMLYLAPAVGVVGGLGAITAYHWSWVVLLAVVAVIAGAGMLFGWLPPLLMLAFSATFPAVTSSASHAAAYGAIAVIATLYGVVLARRFKAPELVEGQRVSLPAAAAVAVVFGVALGGAAAVGVALGWTEPLLCAGADCHPRSLHPHGQAGADTGKGNRHGAWGHRRGPRGDRRTACLGHLRDCRRGVRDRADDVQEILALLRLVYVRSGPGSFSPPAMLAPRQHTAVLRSSSALAFSWLAWPSFILSPPGYPSATRNPNSLTAPLNDCDSDESCCTWHLRRT